MTQKEMHKMVGKLAQDAADEIRKVLEENDICFNEVYPEIDLDPETPMVCVEIEWGDWKHDHGRCDYLCKKLGYPLVKEEQTEESDCDAYSAIHYYGARKAR